MQYADRYVTEADQLATADKYINNGFPGSASSKTQIMISPSNVYMSVVAKRVIRPNEEIVLDSCVACLMPPSLRNASLLEFGIFKCHCVSCTGESKHKDFATARSVRASRVTANSSLSSSSLSSSFRCERKSTQPASGSPPNTLQTQPLHKTHQLTITAGARLTSRSPSPPPKEHLCYQAQATRQKGRSTAMSMSSSSTTTLGGFMRGTAQSSPSYMDDKRRHPSPSSHKHCKIHNRTHQRRTDLVASTDRERETWLKKVAQPLENHLHSTAGREAYRGGCNHSHATSMPTASPSGLDFPPRSLRSGQTDSPAAKDRPGPKPPPREHDVTTPRWITHAHEHGGVAEAFLPKAVKSLQPWKSILGPHVIPELASRNGIPDLGERIYSLMISTQLFKPRHNGAEEMVRDMATFTFPPKP